MHCPFYLAIAIMRIEESDDDPWTQCVEVNSEEINVENIEAILTVFERHPKTELTKRPFKVMLVANDTSGGPKLVREWSGDDLDHCTRHKR